MWLAAVVSGALLVVGALALAVDLPVAGALLEDPLPRDLQRLFDSAVFFGHFYGVLLIVITVGVLDPARRGSLPRLAAATLAAGLVVDVVKLALPRIRPEAFDFGGGVLSTFPGYMPLAVTGEDWASVLRSGQSFPSGHTATAVALALALGTLYPRGRWWFLVIALLVACQRVESGAHYPSDVLCGAAVGNLVAAYAFVGAAPGRIFSRWEARSPGGGSAPDPRKPG